MRVGIHLPQFGRAAVAGGAQQAATLAEGLGYDDVWVSDHLLGIPDPGVPVLEGWTTLAALAGATERIGLGSLVLSASFRPPRVLAKGVQTLASLAGPRLTLGLGAGWHEEEHRAFGLEYEPHARRLTRLEETVDAVRELAPDVPVLVGGASRAAIDLAARKADLWNPPADRLDELPALVERFESARSANGRDVGVVARVGVLHERTRQAAEERLSRRASPWTRIGLGPLGLVGDADEIVLRIRRLQGLGARRLVLGFGRKDLARGGLEAFAGEILSRVR